MKQATSRSRLLVLCTLVFGFASVALAEFDPRPIVDASLDQWQKNNGIGIDADAKGLIKRDVLDAQPRLEQLVKLQASYESSPDAVAEILIRAYCFDLRDAKLKARRPHRAAIVIHRSSFQASSIAPPLRIESGDVQRYSFTDFISQFFPRLQPVGYLEVKSSPDEADILIDKQPKGFTNRIFVVSPGKHSLQVSLEQSHLQCHKVINVNAGRKAVMNCQ